LIIINGRATLATAFKKVKNNKTDPFENSIEYFRNRGFIIPERNSFGSRGSFSILFQDFLFGFGIRMAMHSGLAAAHQLNDDIYSARRILRNLNRKRNVSFINRILYERLSDKQLVKIAVKLSHVSEPLDILSQAYKWNFKNILRWFRFKERYEVRPA